MILVLTIYIDNGFASPPLIIALCTLTERPPLISVMIQPWMISDVWPANEYMFNAVCSCIISCLVEIQGTHASLSVQMSFAA